MRKFFYVSFFLLFTLAIFIFHKPIVKRKSLFDYDMKRHISIQVGSFGSKPWDPFAAYIPKITFNRAVFTSPIYIDSQYRLKPGIFKSWKWDKEKNTYTFIIDTSLEFSRDRPLRITDVEFAFLRRSLTTLNEVKEFHLESISGIENLKKGQKFETGICSGVRILGDNVLEVTLKRPDPDFIYSLGEFFPSVAPIEDFDHDQFSFKGIPRGTGPYEVVWSSPSSSLVKLNLKKSIKSETRAGNFPLSIDLYNHGLAVDNEVDLAIGAGTASVVQLKGFTTVFGKIPHGIKLLEFNLSTKLGADRDFREAISLAINRKSLTQSYPGMPNTFDVIPSKFYGRSAKELEYSPSKAISIVKGKFSNSFSKEKPVEVLFHGSEGQRSKILVENLKQQLSKVGIYIEEKGAERVSFGGEKKSRVFGTYGAVTSFSDPLRVLSPFVKNNPSDKRALKLYQSALNEYDKNRRAKLINELSSLIVGEFKVLPLKEIYPIFSYGPKIESIGEDQIFSSLDLLNIQIKQ